MQRRGRPVQAEGPTWPKAWSMKRSVHKNKDAIVIHTHVSPGHGAAVWGYRVRTHSLQSTARQSSQTLVLSVLSISHMASHMAYLAHCFRYKMEK
jgi:hypothetical protein